MADLTEAKKELTQQLCDLLSPQVYKGIGSIWQSEKNLKKFQEKLALVPKWNSDIIEEEYNRICKKTETKDLLDKLIEATFLANIKVLSSVRMGKTKNINITIPDSKKFIHHCYIEAARKLWSDPHLLDDRKAYVSEQEIKRNNKRLILLIQDSIEKTVSRLIPIQSILENYLTDIIEEEEVDKDSVSDSAEVENSSNEENTSVPEEVVDGEFEDDDLFDKEPELSVTDGKSLEEISIDEKIVKVPTQQKEYFFDSDSEEDNNNDDEK